MKWLDKLKVELASPLPGAEVQWQMAHAARNLIQLPVIPENAVKAAVLILLYPDASGNWSIVLIQRKPHKLDRHSGQISLPGGRLEPEDPGPDYAAAREAEEEVGVPARDIKLLGNLTDLYIPVSGYMVHPFVGVVDFTPSFYPQETEVAGILEAPLPLLLSPDTIKFGSIKLSNDFVLSSVPYFDVKGHVVWGATAMILNEFLWVMRKAKREA